MVHQGGKLCPVAMVGEDMDVQWSNDGMPAVREALDAFIAELEGGKGLKTKHVCGKIEGPGNLFRRSTDDANHGGNGFEFIPLHVATKNLQSIKSDDRFYDFIAKLDQCSFDIFLFSETWRVETEGGVRDSCEPQLVFQRW